jgi:HPt (histidine-containing phosphotransfer) domain-containing protein
VESSSIDQKVLNELRSSFVDDAGQSVFWGLVKRYLNRTSERLKALRRAVNEQDAEFLEIEAHRIKGISSYFGAREMVSLARRIEELAPAQEFAKIDALIDPMREELGRVSKVLMELQRGTP